jgi:hypothetical protein
VQVAAAVLLGKMALVHLEVLAVAAMVLLGTVAI